MASFRLKILFIPTGFLADFFSSHLNSFLSFFYILFSLLFSFFCLLLTWISAPCSQLFSLPSSLPSSLPFSLSSSLYHSLTLFLCKFTIHVVLYVGTLCGQGNMPCSLLLDYLNQKYAELVLQGALDILLNTSYSIHYHDNYHLRTMKFYQILMLHSLPLPLVFITTLSLFLRRNKNLRNSLEHFLNE